MAAKSSATVDRRKAVADILAQRGDALLVTGLGATTWDAAAVGDSPLNFYTWGGMGGTAMIGLGIAQAQPKRRVLVITGDGDMLMGLGSLATIAAAEVNNLAIIVIDNEHYGETGMQETHTHRGVDLAGMAAAAGFRESGTVRSLPELKTWIPKFYRASGPLFTVIKVDTRAQPAPLPVRDGTALKHRFREALLGKKAFD